MTSGDLYSKVVDYESNREFVPNEDRTTFQYFSSISIDDFVKFLQYYESEKEYIPEEDREYDENDYDYDFGYASPCDTCACKGAACDCGGCIIEGGRNICTNCF